MSERRNAFGTAVRHDRRLPVRAVVFDLLTGLLDSWSLWDAVAGDAETGRRWRRGYLELTYGIGRYEPYEELVARATDKAGLEPERARELIARWNELEPWPEAPDALRTLRERGVKLAVATNCSVELGRRATARVGVDFDAVVIAEEVGWLKPRPEMYRAALQALDVQPHDALFLAGSPGDVGGASAVGLPVVWHNRAKLPPREGGPEPLAEIRTLADLPRLAT